ncbi:hypothetical protein PAXRUDRAFT_829070 [Paxillus rubicundulus Ve08.2h10]|uniref:rRNA biogenesis protein RRP36 n=1 Tax=Paxillus rubicundulus Ve08.2h10 TaxID=930991 RepID=A0A0D0E6I3_9AGAM|nr:hypothetical protein PAXRUDRAFT_829070 [Paxillus rubicundulus Ve08.2h10]
MPRRSRPAHRPPPKSTLAAFQPQSKPQLSKSQVAKQARPKAVHFLSESEAEGSTSISVSNDESDAGHTGFDSQGDSEKEDDADADAPRVAQWIDDEESDGEDTAWPGFHSEESDDDGEIDKEVGPSRTLRSLEDDLSTLPLGVLRDAQRSLALAQALSDSGSDEEKSENYDGNSEDDETCPPLTKGKGKERPDPITKPKIDLAKRTNKHAPVEVTSKRPVGRHRIVVEDKTPKPRDPRFLQATGGYDPLKFKQQYGFLSDLHSSELKTLRENLKRARKLLVSTPSNLRAEREEEVKRLELAVKRAESAVNRDTRERIDAEALQSAKHAEKEKRNHGKSDWWMKRSEKRELLTKARFDAIASVGGKQAVKKAIEKKQKKVNQKEKKSRPFARGASGWAGGKRSAGSLDAERGTKRRRLG